MRQTRVGCVCVVFFYVCVCVYVISLHLATAVTGGVCLDTLCCIYYVVFRMHLSGAF